MPRRKIASRGKGPVPRGRIQWFAPLFILASGACSTTSAETEERWYAQVQPRVTGEHCSKVGGSQPVSPDCALLLGYLKALPVTVSGNQVVCVPVDRLRRTPGLWNGLTPRFRKSLRQDRWIAVLRPDGSGQLPLSPSSLAGAPDCTFPAD